MYELLRELGLDNRLINNVPEMPDLSVPDFGGADQILAEKREASWEFLQRNLEAAYKEKCILENRSPE